jgi:signal peptidase II
VIEFLASGIVALCLDQWSKRVAARAGNRRISCGCFLRIRCVRNSRDLYDRSNKRAVLVLIWLVSLAAALILYRVRGTFRGPAALIGLGSAFGGAAGNLLDIWRRRLIIDFIDLRWWPVFNVADLAITAGLVLAFWPGS